MTHLTTLSDSGAPLHQLVRMAMVICRQAQPEQPQPGPGRPVDFADWTVAVLVLVAILKRRLTKGAQYRFLCEHRHALIQWLGLPRFPARSTYFGRYRDAHHLLARALRLHAAWAAKRGRIDARCVAVDKTLIAARGPVWHKGQRARGERPPGVDAEATWSYSPSKGWVYGYGIEVVVSAAATGPVWPLLGSVDPAKQREPRTFPEKIAGLPASTRYVLADTGYDSDAVGEAIEWDGQGRRTGRRFVCPQQKRHNARRSTKKLWRETKRRQQKRWRRDRRGRFFKSRGGRALYRRRGKTVEPFFNWFKTLFDVNTQVWHHGLENNRTMILAALLAYQILLRFNRLKKRTNGQIQWILDGL